MQHLMKKVEHPNKSPESTCGFHLNLNWLGNKLLDAICDLVWPGTPTHAIFLSRLWSSIHRPQLMIAPSIILFGVLTFIVLPGNSMLNNNCKDQLKLSRFDPQHRILCRLCIESCMVLSSRSLALAPARIFRTSHRQHRKWWQQF